MAEVVYSVEGRIKVDDILVVYYITKHLIIQAMVITCKEAKVILKLKL
jgi:hypothetical protein